MQPLTPGCRFLPWGCLFAAPLFAQQPTRTAAAIADNSFLIEEAYNQEAGVVQHISTLLLPGRSRSLFYALTQEWPFKSQRHQVSFTVPLSRMEFGTSGVGDIAINYRYQIGGAEQAWAVAPRVSLVLPTGSVQRGLGDGSTGVQFNLPVSWRVTNQVVTHWNAGFAWLPRAQAPGVTGTVRGSVVDYMVGMSVIAPAEWPVQFMVEQLVSNSGALSAAGVERSTAWIVSPGIRAALNLGKLQVVPGIGVPITKEAGARSTDVFFYLSLEHPFR